MAEITKVHLDALSAFERNLQGYKVFPSGKVRDDLRRAGFIERWNPSLRVTGRLKPWRLTPAGRAALTSEGEG